METSVSEERRRFVAAAQSGHWSLRELAVRYGISRPTAYKWLARFHAAGERGLLDRGHAPHRCPHRTPEAVAALIVAARREYGWGAKKLRQVLRHRHPDLAWPARSTVNAVLDRHGLLRKVRRQRRWAHPGAAPLQTDRPNQVWPIDFKGQFRLGTGAYCYPLTVTDHFSRSLLACHGLPSVASAGAHGVLRALFREVGLPEAIRTDNGTPFASPSLHGLSALNLWWMQLGIVHQRITPARPQENGTHERMHRDLKRETARPPAANPRAQQRRFDAFRHRYNTERPHEALGDVTPRTRWTPSPRPYPERIAPPEYPAALEVRRISTRGTLSFGGHPVFVSEVLRGERVGLEEVDDGLWNIVYYHTLLGRLDVRHRRITGI